MELSILSVCVFFFFKQKTAYEMRISDWSSDVCSSDLRPRSFYREPDNVTIAAVETVEGNQHKLYIPIASSQIDDLDAKRLRKMVLLEDGVTFFRHNKPLLLSSGQRLFSYVVINILGAIRRNRDRKHTSELQSLMRNSYAVFCLNKKKQVY